MADSNRAFLFALVSRGTVSLSEILLGSVKFVPSGRRNHSLKVLRPEGERSLFVKFGRLRNTSVARRETAFYHAVAANQDLALVAALLAPFHSVAQDDRFLCCDLVEGRSACLYRRTGAVIPPTALLQEVGSALGTFHRFASTLLAGVEQLADVPDAFPWLFNIGESFRVDCARPSDVRVLSIINSDQEFPNLLRALESQWDAQALIHGDMKLDNCLVTVQEATSRRIKIVDWEAMQRGDPAWDVAGILHDVWRQWVLSMPTADDISPSAQVENAEYLLGDLRRDLCAFWEAYLETSRLSALDSNAFLLKALRFSGARLIEAVLQNELNYASLSRHSVLMLELSRKLLADPESATSEVF